MHFGVDCMFSNHNKNLIAHFLGEDSSHWVRKSFSENLRYQSCSQSFAELIGYTHWEDLLGLTDFDMRCPAYQNADKFRTHDFNLLTHECDAFFFSSERYSYDKHLVSIGIKKLEKNLQGQLDTVMCQTAFIITPEAYQLTKKLAANMPHSYDSFYYTIDNTMFEKLYFNTKESECLFYLIREYATQEIAKRIGFSAQDTAHLIDIICLKCHCANANDLRHFVIDNNYHLFIPPSIFLAEGII
ncbi:MAG: hypothetical protein DHS20C10_11590 [marine bacterium B5-7]|nr:MAG: hypothetical protein DHS20C10_11590 [marine bacterium B5-7]